MDTRPLKNLLTDIAGVRVGHADDAALGSGTTDPKKVMAAIKGNAWDTVIGTLEFDAKGDIKQLDYVVYKWDSKGGYAEINPKGS